MAILDAFTQLSNAQAITTSAASANVLDTLSELGDALNPGAWLRVAVQTTFNCNDSTDAYVVQLQGADNVTFTTGAVTLVQSASFLEADLAEGKELLVVKLPKNLKRYLRVYYVGTLLDVTTAGKVDAHILDAVDSLITDVEPA